MKFLQVHFLTSYHGTLLNRDDAGLAKRITFGGVPRLRVSSQSQKRHWREWMLAQSPVPGGVRTRHFFDRVVKAELIAGGISPDLATSLTRHLASKLLKVSGERGGAALEDDLSMKQPVLFGRREADYFVGLLRQAAATGSETAAIAALDQTLTAQSANFKALLREAGIPDPVVGFEGALFGRFVTSDVLARVDAPVHVAHALTTHEVDTEIDYFTVVDDLARDEETGAAHANDMELGAGIFYGYVVVDVPLLVANMTGCDRQAWQDQDSDEARTLIALLIRAIAEVSPGAKLGATAPYARAECVVLECGDAQPRSLANAYLKPIRLGGDRHPMAASVQALSTYMDALDAMYGPACGMRAVTTIHPWPHEAERVLTLQEATDRALDALFGGA